MALLGLTASGVQADDAMILEVRVEKMENTEGRVVVALFTDAKSFLEKALIDQAVAIDGDQAVARFEGLAPGTYAVSAYHDINDNDRLDRNFLGLPLEPYAFSNQAPVNLAPPTWEAARIVLDGPFKRIVIRLGEH
ncbi:DUF2141 domain-containing protein [Magnetospira sp. QH-2]|uniref:DUF2141 domain-containing protein n=1 Tax=Magnetospira sp. (strain QH-2) TaxID=1288970 RepID=UPI0003E80FAB|nr:DUF2141 domain-containing protein [Magnetospira sp. QH-2]CCQ74200.1 Protein of unknown function [Magnetospira sp. QH-2]